ncbi:MAG: DNA polymerase I [Actinomycetota bacterium]|nr:DNA polymerase I [Actinomycetota bacterium]
MEKNKKNKAILIDGNNIAYRAFYAIPETISTSSGIATNAVLGFTNMLLKLIEQENPDTIICAFDSKKPTFRHELFDRYKIQRKKMPDSLSDQLPLIKEVLNVFNIACLEKDGLEADDILADIAESIKDEFDSVIIVSGDKDILQLVSDKIKVMSIKRGITDTVMFNREGVVEKFGIEPEKIKDLLALMGDSSDNIPGIPGIGPGTAKSLVKKYGSVEEIYENLDKIDSRRLKELLLANRDLAILSKELTTLKRSGDIKVRELVDNSFKNISINKVKQLFESLEFRNLIKKLYNLQDKIDFKKEDIESSKAVKRIDAINKIDLKHLTPELCDEILEYGSGRTIYIALWEAFNEFCGIILYFGNGNGSAFLVEKKELGVNKVRESIKKLLENKENKISGFDFKKIYKTLKRYGITLDGKYIDYKILYLLLNPVKPDTTIDEIIYDLLKIEPESIEEEIRSEKEIKSVKDNKNTVFVTTESENENENKGERKQLSLNLNGGVGVSSCGTDKEQEESRSAEAAYELEILNRKLSLYEKIESKLLEGLAEEDMGELYWKIEEPLIRIIAEMEYTGVCIDREYLNDLIKEYDREIKNLEKEIYKLCGEEFNINSSRQLAEVLYNKLGLPAVKRTKTGLSTDAESLRAIYDSSPVIAKILDYREKTKLKNTYIDVLPGLIDPVDLRVHATYHQLGTSTGRISSSDPNLQNIPVRTEYGRQIRKAFVPGAGYDIIMSADYSQIELRILAHLSEDEILVDSFRKDEDIHARTASELFDVDYNEVTEDLRRKAKAINFGIIYGMTEYGLMNRLSISEEEAREYIKKYFDRYQGVNKYLKFLIEEAYKKGYSTTIFGRKRYLRELGSSNSQVRRLGERYAVNTPIQGSAADIIKLSTIVLFNRLKSEKLDSNIILHVHDELVLELKEKDSEIIKKILRESMENCVKLKVNLKVDIKSGVNWYI